MDIILMLLAVLVPSVATYLTLQALKTQALIDGLPGFVKQVLALVIAAVFAKLSALIGVPFPMDLGGFADSTIAQGVVAGFFSWVIHRLFQKA